VFGEALEQAIKIVAMLPIAGTPYVQSPVPGVRRVYPRKAAAHRYYYPFDEDEVISSHLPCADGLLARGSE
jgi:hypothetical protein